MYMYPPAPTPDPSLESAEAPLSFLGKGPRKGRPAHNHAMVQELQLWNYTDIKKKCVQLTMTTHIGLQGFQ